MWPVHTVGFHSAIKRNTELIRPATWMNLDRSVLREKPVTETTCRRAACAANACRRQTHGDRTRSQGLGEGGERLLMSVGFFFGGDENVVEYDSGDGGVTLRIHQTPPELHTLKGRILWYATYISMTRNIFIRRRRTGLG